MIIESTILPEVKVIIPEVFSDERGYFLETYQKNKFIENKIPHHFYQDNEVKSKKHTIRGLHYQTGETSQAKLVKVINGRILDFVVDLRVPLRSYNNCQFFEMKGGDELIVPRDFAHGFITLEENTVVQYLVDNDYSPENEGSIYWNEFPEIRETIKEFFDGKLSTNDLIISHKDNYTKNFTFDK